MAVRVLLIVALLAGSALSAVARQQESQQQERAPAAPAADSSSRAGADQRVNVDRLPLDLQRLERQLRVSGEQQDWDGFKLRYTVEVFGTAPRLRFFEPKDVLPSGPIPYGAPTHQEMIEMMTPKEYRAPAMDFSALMRWLQEKMK